MSLKADNGAALKSYKCYDTIFRPALRTWSLASLVQVMKRDTGLSRRNRGIYKAVYDIERSGLAITRL